MLGSLRTPPGLKALVSIDDVLEALCEFDGAPAIRQAARVATAAKGSSMISWRTSARSKPCWCLPPEGLVCKDKRRIPEFHRRATDVQRQKTKIFLMADMMMRGMVPRQHTAFSARSRAEVNAF